MSAGASDQGANDQGDQGDDVDLNSMTKAELLAYAEENGITGLSDSMTKDEIIAAIEEALA